MPERTPWEVYVAQPTEENAKAVREIRYSELLPEFESSDRLFRDLAVLEEQVELARPEAVKLAVRQMPSADGHLAETLDIMLGNVIVKAPLLFLEALSNDGELPPRVDGLCCNLGDEYVDCAPVICADKIRARIKALMGVQHPGPLRGACIKELQRCLAHYE